MNKLVLSAVLALSGLASYAQGVINGFNAFNPPGSSVPALVYESIYGYTPVATSIGRAEVWTIDGTMVLSPTKDGQGDPFVAPGVFSLGMMTIPNSTVGSHASVILRTWDNSTGSTFSNALFRAQVVVNFPTVGSAMSPSNFVLDSDFTGLVFFIPEPATVVLATLGLVGTFLVAGRRN